MLRRPALLGLLALAGGCQFLPLPGDAPRAPAPAAPAAAPAAPKPVIVGAFGSSGCDDANCRQAQALAVETIYAQDPQRGIVENSKAEVQVVAGLNYKFHIQMTGANRYTIVVYRDLMGNLSVTSFQKEITPH
jgi:hypothetical protein